MPENVLEEGATIEPQSLQARGFETLQELVRHGYKPDPRPLPRSSGMLVRHDAAPDLILYPDGRLELPEGRPARGASLIEVASRRRISWRRGLLFLFLLVAYTLISAVVIINLIAD